MPYCGGAVAAALSKHEPCTFRALRATYGTLYVRCDLWLRHAPLSLTGILDVDYRADHLQLLEVRRAGLAVRRRPVSRGPHG
jgi:hypothetical protein